MSAYNERHVARQRTAQSYLLGSKSSQVELCGNSVSPPVAAAIVRANCLEQQQLEAA
jgi:site-specific DNA-cytosine methylase